MSAAPVDVALDHDIAGVPTVRTVLDAFYSRALADEVLSPFFLGIDVERLKKAQERFIAIALGGPGQYAGRGLAEVHARTRQRGVNDEVFDHYLGVLKRVLVDLHLPHARIHEWLRMFEGTRGEIFSR
jgi:hemoglobin